ncbi:MAG: TIGR02221 family CRISPR-associated protein [Deltaproteobacteria bacterium]|nr:TIGR02221 family CRISPR-associated protein [Deltaproteobacteria bacterium]
MFRTYMSCLGLGTFNESVKKYEYKQANYELDGKRAKPTEFVQVAEAEILGPDSFDRFLIVPTQKSYDYHFHNLNAQLTDLGVTNIIPLIVEEDMSAENQWKWFEQILEHIEPGAELTVDLTHGYRSLPIIISTAINFLQKARNIRLNAVYYGVYDKQRVLGFTPIIDMKDFYIINEWAEAVSRLVEDADARKMADLAVQTPEFQAGELNNQEIIDALDDLTNTVRNVDINNVAIKANTAIRLVKKAESHASTTGRILLNLVLDKFTSVATDEPLSGFYDRRYFILQLEIIKLLLEHRLFMQAYTVMREFIGSIGLIGIEGAKIDTAKGRKRRYRFAEVFINMYQFDRDRWNFSDQQQRSVDKLIPFYEKLEKIGIGPMLRQYSKILTEYRNGFDHAWTMKPETPNDIEKTGNEIFANLNNIIDFMVKNGILS